MFWMTTNRRCDEGKPGDLTSERGPLSYWMADARSKELDSLGLWYRVTSEYFKKSLVDEVGAYPLITNPEYHVNQKHVTIFIHGYNNHWIEAAKRYQSLCSQLFTGEYGLGTCILFCWPSFGSPADYLPDRAHAEASATDLADVLEELYDWLVGKQTDAAKDPLNACRAKVSIIAHSMGNFVLQKAMQTLWTRKNRPALVSLVNQLLMVAADVDNDLFASGEKQEASDGNAVANLVYRITAFYSGRDQVLGVSAGLKHFGKRRLGRSGLDKTVPCSDNVWDLDCTELFPTPMPEITHSAYFDSPVVLNLMNLILRGVDRGQLPGVPK